MLTPCRAVANVRQAALLLRRQTEPSDGLRRVAWDLTWRQLLSVRVTLLHIHHPTSPVRYAWRVKVPRCVCLEGIRISASSSIVFFCLTTHSPLAKLSDTDLGCQLQDLQADLAALRPHTARPAVASLVFLYSAVARSLANSRAHPTRHLFVEG